MLPHFLAGFFFLFLLEHCRAATIIKCLRSDQKSICRKCCESYTIASTRENFSRRGYLKYLKILELLMRERTSVNNMIIISKRMAIKRLDIRNFHSSVLYVWCSESWSAIVSAQMSIQLLWWQAHWDLGSGFPQIFPCVFQNHVSIYK